MSNRSALVRQAVIATLAFAAAPTFAQQVAQNNEEGGRTIENIIVTAQKREQSLQDVPIVVTAVSEQLLQDTGVKDIKDLTVLTPGLTVTSTSSEASTTARIRGVGTVGDNPGLESSVGVVIDGVYRPRNGVGFGDLGELERIEVLKGPQGTLFGKNTSAGVINIVTKKPEKEFGSSVEVTAGDYGLLEGSASITGPLREGVSARLFVGVRERDGFYDVNRGAGPRTETDDTNRNVETARGQLLLEPSEATDIRLTLDYSKRDETCCGGPQTVRSVLAPAIDALSGGKGVNRPAEVFDRNLYMNRTTESELEDQGASLEINHDFEIMTLTSVTAWRNWDFSNGQDVDYSSTDVWFRSPDGNNGAKFEQFSQEIRLAGETDHLNWLVGAFYANEDLESLQQIHYGTQFRSYLLAINGSNPASAATLAGFMPASSYTAGLGQKDRFVQDSRSWAVFSNFNINFTDALELTLGARYTNEAKDLDSTFRNTHDGSGCRTLRQNLATIATLPGVTPALVYGYGCANFADPNFNSIATKQDLDEDELSGTAKLALRFSDQIMGYASWARGYKASGFNLDRVRQGAQATLPIFGTPNLNTRFDKELVDSYELGVKTQWLGNSLLVNLSGFYQEYADFQLNTFDGVQFLVTSLEEVTSEGFDLDTVWFTPIEQLSVQGGVTFAKTEIHDPTALANPGLFSPTRPNNRLSFAPEWSASLSLTFEQPFGSLVWRTNVGAKYTSEYNTGSNLHIAKMQDELTILTARTGIGAADETWTVEAWGQNLTDEEYYQVVFDAPLQAAGFNAFLGAPLMYGMTARFKF